MNNIQFVILEGGEGAGKSTLVRSLMESLEAEGKPVFLTREPGGSLGAEAIRSLIIHGSADRFCPDTHMLLHYAARLDHLNASVIPALHAGKLVISDRFEISSFAYQVHAMDASLTLFQSLHAHVCDVLAPYLSQAVYLHCDVDAAEGLRRVRKQASLDLSAADSAQREAAAEDRPDDDAYDALPLEFHNKLREGMLISKQYINNDLFSHVHIDASQPMEAVFEEARTVLRECGV